LQTHQFAIS